MTEETRTTESPVTDEENPAQAVGDAGVKGALARFRVLAYIVGVGLLALCFGMVMNYVFDQSQYSAIIGPAASGPSPWLQPVSVALSRTPAIRFLVPISRLLPV